MIYWDTATNRYAHYEDSMYFSESRTLGVIIWDTITGAAVVIMGDN